MDPEFPSLGFYFTSCYESVRHVCAVDPIPTRDSAAELREQHSDKDLDFSLDPSMACTPKTEPGSDPWDHHSQSKEISW